MATRSVCSVIITREVRHEHELTYCTYSVGLHSLHGPGKDNPFIFPTLDVRFSGPKSHISKTPGLLSAGATALYAVQGQPTCQAGTDKDRQVDLASES